MRQRRSFSSEVEVLMLATTAPLRLAKRLRRWQSEPRRDNDRLNARQPKGNLDESVIDGFACIWLPLSATVLNLKGYRRCIGACSLPRS
ncbi:hypothetical protein, partial [Telmatospirillum sp.]|uniref:hypothetical protein n=1 Tax=Telmatospirillum sp. TaxID=2079197 RepID=UPI002848F79C